MMNMAKKVLIAFLLLTSIACVSNAAHFRKVADIPGIVTIAAPNDGSGRLFLVQQNGQIRILTGGQLLGKPFLRIAGLISCCGEQGLLGLAFHPEYKSNGFFFVYYTNTDGNIVIARYRVSSTNRNVANPQSALKILTIPHPNFGNHNGGQLQFGRDGYLYIGTGDGGSGGDPPNNAQNRQMLLGKLLRIDVTNSSGSTPYRVPPDNPFVGTSDARPEIWAFGLRNPWRFSFDRQTGDLFIGDVGQGSFEEVDFQPRSGRGGENYGWRLMEGKHCFNPSTGCNPGGLRLPILEYSHGSDNCSVTGGYRYRGSAIPALRGAYIYADFCSGRIFRARPANGQWTAGQLADTEFNISTFGEDAAGELYFADLSGGVYKIVP